MCSLQVTSVDPQLPDVFPGFRRGPLVEDQHQGGVVGVSRAPVVESCDEAVSQCLEAAAVEGLLQGFRVEGIREADQAVGVEGEQSPRRELPFCGLEAYLGVDAERHSHVEVPMW